MRLLNVTDEGYQAELWFYLAASTKKEDRVVIQELIFHFDEQKSRLHFILASSFWR